MAMWLSAKVVPSSDDAGKRTKWYFDINALGLALAAGVAVGATALLAGRRPWDAAMFAVAPTLALAGDDQLGPVRRRAARPRHAGLGPGETRGRGRADRARGGDQVLPAVPARAAAGAVPAGRPDAGVLDRAARPRPAAGRRSTCRSCWPTSTGWSKFYRLSQERGVGFGSVWFVLSQQGHAVPDGALNLVAGGLFALACAGIAVLALVADRRPRLPQLAFLVVAAFLLTNKVYSPQYVLWLLPLVVLARPRWRDFLIWQAAEVAALRRHLDAARGLPAGPAGTRAGRRRVRPHGAGARGGDAVAVRDGGARHPAARSTTRSAPRTPTARPTTTRPAASSTAPPTPSASSPPDPPLRQRSPPRRRRPRMAGERRTLRGTCASRRYRIRLRKASRAEHATVAPVGLWMDAPRPIGPALRSSSDVADAVPAPVVARRRPPRSAACSPPRRLAARRSHRRRPPVAAPTASTCCRCAEGSTRCATEYDGADPPVEHGMRVAALGLALTAPAVLSHESAATELGLELLDPDLVVAARHAAGRSRARDARRVSSTTPPNCPSSHVVRREARSISPRLARTAIDVGRETRPASSARWPPSTRPSGWE